MHRKALFHLGLFVVMLCLALSPVGQAQAGSRGHFGGEPEDHDWEMAVSYCFNGFFISASEVRHTDPVLGEETNGTGDALPFSLQLGSANPAVTAPLPNVGTPDNPGTSATYANSQASRIAGSWTGKVNTLVRGAAAFWFQAPPAAGTLVYIALQRWDHNHPSPYEGEVGDSSGFDEIWSTYPGGDLPLFNPSWPTDWADTTAGRAGADNCAVAAVDIQPGVSPNVVDQRAADLMPVAILGAPSFDATKVNPATVTVAGAPAKVFKFTDANHDGRRDLVVYVSARAFQLWSTDTSATLLAKTYSGQAVMGVDAIQIR